MEDQIEEYIKEILNDNPDDPLDLDHLRYRDVFPKDIEGEETSFDAILIRLTQEDQETPFDDLYQKAKRLYERAKGS
jgi:hypothetical protein